MALPIRVLAWNIGGLLDADHPHLIPAQAAAINAADPDIVLLNEATRIGPDPVNNQVLELSALTQLKHVAFAVTVDLGLFAIRGQKLVGILSKFPLSNTNELPRVCDSWPNGGCYRTIEVQATIQDRLYFLYATRWSAFVDANNAMLAAQLRDRIASLRSNYRQACFIVGGDLNQGSIADILNASPPAPFPPQLTDFVRGAGLIDAINGDMSQPPILDAGGRIFNDYVMFRGPLVAEGAREGPMSGPGQGSGTEHYYVFASLHPHDAAFVRQKVPGTAILGTPLRISFTFRNTGNSAWELPQQVCLRMQSPQGWTRVDVSLAERVAAGTEVTVDFETVPMQIGHCKVQVRLEVHGTWSFGEASPAIDVTVMAADPEPAACLDLREQIQLLDEELQQLQDTLTGDPRQDAQAKMDIARVSRQREKGRTERPSSWLSSLKHRPSAEDWVRSGPTNQ